MTLTRADCIENLRAGLALLERHAGGGEPADALREALVARLEQLTSASSAGRITAAAEVSA